jgi:hypothetical protein
MYFTKKESVMKRLMIVFTALSFIAFSGQAQVGGDYFDDDTVAAGDAVKYEDEGVVVCDVVNWIYTVDTMEGKPALIKLSDHKKGLTLVIWEEDHDIFGKPLDEVFTTGTSVCVGGPIELFHGEARMEIGYTDQVHFLNRRYGHR